MQPESTTLKEYNTYDLAIYALYSGQIVTLFMVCFELGTAVRVKFKLRTEIIYNIDATKLYFQAI